MTEYKYDIKIPKERIAVLIGKNGETKKLLEQETKTNINVDSEEGDVSVAGEDAITLYSTREIITAIGRGFNPNIALNLTKVDYGFELINLGDAARSKNDMIRLKGRVIGQEGKSRRVIEELTDCEICVYGKTIGIIGPVERMGTARRAIEMLIEGSMHSTVYKFLEKQRRELSMQQAASGGF
jgi:ribosomal RNA assembly protein